jgi:hypothetical protein
MTEKKVIERMIELRQLEEKKALDDKQKQELIDLSLKNAELTRMSLEQLQDELKKSAPEQEVSVKSNNLNDIIDDYKKKFGQEDWYKEPEAKNGKVDLVFPSKEAASNFMLEQAEKNRPFVVVDGKTNQVMAYSNGDGTLYHGDGKPFAKGDELSPSGGDINNFRMPLSKMSNLAPMSSETVQDTGKGVQDTAVSKPAEFPESGVEAEVDNEQQSDIKPTNP